jgi:hypothetical protein
VSVHGKKVKVQDVIARRLKPRSNLTSQPSLRGATLVALMQSKNNELPRLLRGLAMTLGDQVAAKWLLANRRLAIRFFIHHKKKAK